MILHKYRNGDRLFAEGENYIVNSVFRYHLERKSKVSGEINYFMVYIYNNRSSVVACPI